MHLQLPQAEKWGVPTTVLSCYKPCTVGDVRLGRSGSGESGGGGFGLGGGGGGGGFLLLTTTEGDSGGIAGG